MKWRAKFFELLPSLLQEYPNARFLFLKLTVPNCPVEDLSIKISDMNKAWQRLIKRKEFKNVLGWVRTLEITKEGVKEGFSDRKHYAHPHFHCLLMVSSTYFGGRSYVPQEKWQAAWSESMRDSSISSVHIKAVKADSHDALMKQICETLKYSVKVGNVLGDDDWFLTMAEQTYRKRLIASGGVIKGFLGSSVDEDDLIDSSPVSVHSGAVYVYGHHEDFCVPYYKKSKPSDF
jgi:plasmid rolling circle replication initiator protein Rep